jgi:hypothetical protein
MRNRYAMVFAVAAAAILAFGFKNAVLAPKAVATVSQPSAVSMDELHRNAKDLPVMEITDPI